MDLSQVWSSPLDDPRYSQNVFRYNTGGASPMSNGIASQLVTGNAGTQAANLQRQSAERGSQDMYRRMSAQMSAGGNGGNLNALASMGIGLQNGVNASSTDAYSQAAKTNQAGVQAGGQLSAQNDQLNQKANNDSLNYLHDMNRQQIDPGNLKLLQNQALGLTPEGTQQESFGSSILKSIGGGILGGLGGDLGGWLGDQIFSKNPYGSDEEDLGATGVFSKSTGKRIR